MDFLFAPSDEHRMLRESVRAFAKNRVEPQAFQANRDEIFNLDLFRELGALGLLGITVPEVDGGAGLDALAAVVAHEELAAVDAGFCLAYLAHSMLCVNNLAENGSEAQKRKFLPKLCSGEYIGAMAMSEPGAGTDVLAMRTSAKRVGNDYTLQGQKMWITNGCIDDNGTSADVVLVYAKTGVDAAGKAEISTFVVERGMPGFSVGQKITGKLGMRSSTTAELVFNSCAVPVENRIGAEGGSLIQMMRNLAVERVALAAMSLGIARRAIEIMVNYANQRRAFGAPIRTFGQIQSYIAKSYAEYMAAKTYVYATAKVLSDSKLGSNRLDSDGVKLFAAPTAKSIADRAIQVLGGNGYIEEYIVERLWRDAKLLEIGGGTIESHEKNITKDLSKVSDSSTTIL